MRKIALLILIGLVGFVWSALAQENDEFDALIGVEDEVYSYTAPLAGQVTFRSPLRNSADGSDDFVRVTSKNGQPRTTGSNPHIGVDLQPIGGGEGRAVYPVRNGRVYWVDPVKYGRVTIQLDVNGDGEYDLATDNLFVTYLHMKNIAVAEGQDVAIDKKVGEISNKGTSTVHLHFEINTITGGSDCASDFRLPGCTVVRMHRYYEGLIAAQWSGGRDLDFITDIAWRDSRIADAHVYAMTNGAYEDVREGDVILFHRQQGAAVWNSAPMNKNGDLFFLNLS